MTTPLDLTADLRALPHPAPPPDMTGIVLARIAQLDETQVVLHGAAIPAAAPRRADWSVWISLGGLVVGGIVVVLNFPISADTALLGRGGAMASLKDVSTAPMATVSLVAGFAIYLVSLFLPVRERR